MTIGPTRLSDEIRYFALRAPFHHLAQGHILQDLWVPFESDLRSGGWFCEVRRHDGTTHGKTRLLKE